MEITKKVLIACLTLLFVIPATAQRHHKKVDPEERVQRMEEKLNLSEEQKEAIIKILEDNKASMEEIMENEDLTREEKRSQMKTLRSEIENQIKSNLNEEQQGLMEEMKKQRPKRKKRFKGKKNAKERKALKKDIKAYLDTNVKPVVAVWRAELEKEISVEDKATIAQLRADFKSKGLPKAKWRKGKPAKGEGKQYSPGSKGEKSKISREEREKMRAERKAKREAMKTEMKAKRETLKALVEKYDAPIQAILDSHEEEIEELRKSTKTDIQAIIEKSEAEFHSAHFRHGRFLKVNNKARFLLLEPQSELATRSSEKNTNSVIYPNPSGTYSTLDYTIAKEATVLIKLSDQEGRTIEILKNEKHSAGSHSLNIPLGNLSAGTYLVTIASDNGLETRKLIVSK